MLKKINFDKNKILIVKNILGRTSGEVVDGNKKIKSFSDAELKQGISFFGKKIRAEYISKFFLIDGILNVYIDEKLAVESDISSENIRGSFQNISLVFFIGTFIHLMVLWLLRGSSFHPYVWGFLKSVSIGISVDKPNVYSAVAGIAGTLCLYLCLKLKSPLKNVKAIIFLFLTIVVIDTFLFALSIKGLGLYILIVRYFLLAKPSYLFCLSLKPKNKYIGH